MKPPAGRLLFDAPEKPVNLFVANVDGASRGNPGPASYAVIVRGPDGATCFEVGKYLGRATNNVAEYYGLITALDYAAAQGIDRLLVRSDSELLVRQMQGRYKVKSTDLRPLYERARKMANGLAHFAIEHVPRELNREADELANLALDRTGSRSGGSAASAAEAEAKPDRKPDRKPDWKTDRKPDQKIDAKPAKSEAAARSNPAQTRGESSIRARYSAGALHPHETLDLNEGEIVELTIRRSKP
jgi:probable phosphoglycerate mutase